MLKVDSDLHLGDLTIVDFHSLREHNIVISEALNGDIKRRSLAGCDLNALDLGLTRSRSVNLGIGIRGIHNITLKEATKAGGGDAGGGLVGDINPCEATVRGHLPGRYQLVECDSIGCEG